MGRLIVAQLLDEPSLRLSVVGEALHLDRAVLGTHVSDLDRPGIYLLPDELVLTNGLWLERVEADDWVAEAKAAGAAAVAFGLSAACIQVPQVMADACTRVSLALLQVPADLSFSVVTDWVRRHDGANPGEARVQLTRLRRVVQDLARGGGYDAVLDAVRRETKTPVWIVGPGGRDLAGQTPVDPGAGRAAVRAARRGALPCTVGQGLSAFGVGGRALSTTAIIVGAPLAEVSDEARLLIDQIAAYLVLDVARRGAQHAIRSSAAAELIRLSWDGELSEGSAAKRVVTLGFQASSSLTVVASSNAEDDLAYAAAGCGTTCVAARFRDLTLLLVEGVDPGTTAQLVDLVADGGAQPVFGVGQASDAAGLRQAIAAAVVAHQLALSRPAGDQVVDRLDVGSHVLLLEFLDPRVLRSYRDSVLEPVRRWDAQHNTMLVETIAAFLANDGHPGRTAASLHVHPNTLRYRLDRAAELTGRSSSETSGRVDFALALAIDALLSD